jgi:beta-N-acetylhexosaminidase
MVMTAHLKVSAWDKRPATLSPVALQVWLRRRLGFQGVIITDDLEMGGITSSLSAPQGAHEALAAGADLLLICNNWQAAWESARLLAMDASLVPRGREAAARLNSLRQTLKGEPAELPAVREYFAR